MAVVEFKDFLFLSRVAGFCRVDGGMRQKVLGDRANMTPSERHHRLTQIFIAVCNLDGEERRRELDRLCQGNSDLRAEIELLLSFHDSATRPPLRPNGPSKASLS